MPSTFFVPPVEFPRSAEYIHDDLALEKYVTSVLTEHCDSRADMIYDFAAKLHDSECTLASLQSFIRNLEAQDKEKLDAFNDEIKSLQAQHKFEITSIQDEMYHLQDGSVELQQKIDELSARVECLESDKHEMTLRNDDLLARCRELDAIRDQAETLYTSDLQEMRELFDTTRSNLQVLEDKVGEQDEKLCMATARSASAEAQLKATQRDRDEWKTRVDIVTSLPGDHVAEIDDPVNTFTRKRKRFVEVDAEAEPIDDASSPKHQREEDSDSEEASIEAALLRTHSPK